MKEKLKLLASVLIALVLVVIILFASSFAATSLKKSSLVSQSEILRQIITEEDIGYNTIFTSKEKQKMVTAFLAAVTDAYINFELIPLNEGETFATVFKSMNNEITIEAFQYHRRDLEITGSATTESFANFVAELEKTQHFANVSQQWIIPLEDNRIEFILYCVAKMEPLPTFGELGFIPEED